MGFFADLFGLNEDTTEKKAERGRPRGPGHNPNKTPKEKAEREQWLFLQRMKKTNPEAYDTYMARKMGFPMPQPATPAPQPSDRLEDWVETTEALRNAGLLNNPREDLADDDNKWIKDLIANLPLVIASMRGGLVVPSATAQNPDSSHALPPGEATRPHTEEAPLSIISGYVIGQLNGKSPDEAARWLGTLPYPQAAELINAFRQTPDDQILVLLSELASRYPDFRGLVEWLRQRPDWTISTIQALRRTEAPEGASSVAHGL